MTNLHVIFNDLRPSPLLASELNAAYDRVAGSGKYIGGREVEAFERAWADYCNVNFCVGVGNGHDALALACRYFNPLKFVDKNVYAPWKTCLPTWAAANSARLSPSCDEKRYHEISIAVHIYGEITLPAVRSDDIDLIEDCAQAHGATLNDVKAGKFGAVAAWSFYPTKNLGALGDAGAVTTDNEEIAYYVRTHSTYGTPSDTGINSRLDPLQAAFLLAKLPHLDEWNRRREDNAHAYCRTIRSDVIDVPVFSIRGGPCWHIFAIEVHDRDGLATYLREHGVETMVHYRRPPYPQHILVPEAERWVSRTLSLPIAPHVTPEQCRQIGELINQWTLSKRY